MPVVSVSIPHSYSPDDVKERAEPYIEKMVDDFEGHDLDLEWDGHKADFSFKSLAFKITGHVEISTEDITVNVDLPIMAMIFKDKVEKAIHKNLTRALAEHDPEAPGDAEAPGDQDSA